MLRGEGATTEVVLASRRTRTGDLAWGLPKGLIEPGEDAAAAAIREVREETGLRAEIEAPLGDIGYRYVWDGRRVQKRVTFFLMRALGGDIAEHDREMEDVRWFPAAQAGKRASYRGERRIIARAMDALGSARTHG